MMGSDQYCLKWNNHWANLVRVFNSLRHSETFVDVTLACEGRHLKAHRLVLSACSPYFKDLLVSHPDKHPIVILKDVRYSELQSLIQFIYNGEVSVEQTALASLLGTAKDLQIRGLAENSVSDALPAGVVKEIKNSLKDSTKLPSILVQTKSHEEVEGGDLSHTNGSIDTPPPAPSSGSPPHFIPYIAPPEASDRPPTADEDEVSTPNGGVDDSSRTGSPLYKRRKLSKGSTETSDEGSAEPDEVTKALVISSPKKASDEAPKSEPEGVQLSDEKENVEPEEADTEVVELDKSPDASKKASGTEDESDLEAEAMSLQQPEIILEEESGVVTTNGTASPMFPRNTSASNSHSDAPITSTTQLSLDSQMSFLQTAFAMGFQQPFHFLHPPDDHNHKTTPGSQQPLSPSSGLMQAKNILTFVDFLKAMGASFPPTSQSNRISGSSPSPGSQGCSVPNSSSSSPILSRDQEKNPLTCHICARIMPSLPVLEEHVRIHEEEKPYKCDQCGQRYKYQSAFQRHQEQNHTAKLPGDKPYRCDVCGQCFKYHKSFTKHRANHDLLDSFLKTEPGDELNGKGAIRALQESYLQRLLHPHHPFAQADGIIAIKEEVNDSNDLELSKDSKSPCAVSSTSVPGGLGSENGEIKEEEDDEIDIDEIVPDVPCEGEEDGDDPPSGRFFYCTRCKLTFRDMNAFEGHCRLSPMCSHDSLKEVCVGDDISVTSIPSAGALSSQLSPRSLVNNQSALTSPNATPLSTSLVLSSPPGMFYTLVSGLNQAGFPNAANPTILNLSKFVNVNNIPNFSRHPDAFNFAAGGIPSAVNSLLAGMEEDRPFKCPYCQKGFKGRENLKLHIRTHTGEKPYNCGVCGKAFGGRSDMNRHLRIHTGEKPYPCKVCGKKFARADYLSKHITTHLGIPFAKPVHSLQQSLQNLENMQNLQNLENLQNLSSANFPLASLPALQNLQGLPGFPGFHFQNLQMLQQPIPGLQPPIPGSNISQVESNPIISSHPPQTDSSAVMQTQTIPVISNSNMLQQPLPPVTTTNLSLPPPVTSTNLSQPAVSAISPNAAPLQALPSESAANMLPQTLPAVQQTTRMLQPPPPLPPISSMPQQTEHGLAHNKEIPNLSK